MSEYLLEMPSGRDLRARGAALLASLARRLARTMVTAALAIPALLGAETSAAAEERKLKLFFTHTGERATITYKRDGRFDPKGLAQINRFLRDWRKNEPARMDPRLLDLVWEVYDRSGARDYIHIVSAYRSPSTNNMLRGRSRSTGVAKNSQHTLGKAMDFYIPGVKLATLRTLAMQMQVGGVGFYPTSGSPFVHLDVGNVRAWPRMSRQELARIFPNGKTMHLPSNGKAPPGYDIAVADYKKRVGRSAIQVADTGKNDAVSPATRRGGDGNGLLAALLPSPRNSAQEALTLQTSDGMPLAGGKPGVDLLTLSIPVPLRRPVAEAAEDALLQTASIGPITTLADTHITEQSQPPVPRRPDFASFTMPAPSATIAALPLAARQQLDAGIAAISADALTRWALHPHGTALAMTAPAFARETIENTPASEGDHPLAIAENFDDSRFGLDPEG